MTEKRSFEKAMTELEGIVRQLESNDLTLDDSLKAFEKGVTLTRECETYLTEAKGKVEKLVRDADGVEKTEAFEPREA